MVNAWRVTMPPSAAPGSATCAATTSGRRDEANHAAVEAPSAVTTSIAPSHAAGCDERRTMLAPAAAPSARPRMKEPTTVVNAYVVGPMTRTRRRVHAISYTSATHPEMAAAAIATRGIGAAGRRGIGLVADGAFFRVPPARGELVEPRAEARPSTGLSSASLSPDCDA